MFAFFGSASFSRDFNLFPPTLLVFFSSNEGHWHWQTWSSIVRLLSMLGPIKSSPSVNCSINFCCYRILQLLTRWLANVWIEVVDMAWRFQPSTSLMVRTKPLRDKAATSENNERYFKENRTLHVIKTYLIYFCIILKKKKRNEKLFRIYFYPCPLYWESWTNFISFLELVSALTKCPLYGVSAI